MGSLEDKIKDWHIFRPFQYTGLMKVLPVVVWFLNWSIHSLTYAHIQMCEPGLTHHTIYYVVFRFVISSSERGPMKTLFQPGEIGLSLLVGFLKQGSLELSQPSEFMCWI